MDYSAKLDQILYEISIVGSNTNVMKQQLEDIRLRDTLIMEELQEMASGDNLRNKVEQINTSTALIAIVITILLIYNFIVRSLK